MTTRDAEVAMVPVAGATLYTEARGAGPLLLFIVGGNGDPSVFTNVAIRLSERYRVVSYVRRGFVRSPLDSAPEDAKRVYEDAEDAATLIERHTTSPAFVVGSSSGAIVALELALRHPVLVRNAVVHEPPLLEYLDDPDGWAARLQEIVRIYEANGIWPALALFAETVGLNQPAPPSEAPSSTEMREMVARSLDNKTFWIEHELIPYPLHHVELSDLRKVVSRITLAGGHASGEADSLPSRTLRALAGRLDVEIVEFPGGHVGYLEQPDAFALALEALFRRSP